MALAPTLTLSDGRPLPRLGLGTWPLDDAAAATVVRTGIELGYRLVDTATFYGNEVGVGRGVAAADVPREDVVVTTKLHGPDHGYEPTLAAFEASRRRLGLEYVDLYLIHWPLPHLDLYVESWRAFVHLQQEGLVRSIGVSNFLPDHLDRIVEATGVTPAVDQIEVHPGFGQVALREELRRREIVVQAYSPLGADTPVIGDPTIVRIAGRIGRTPAQVALRWLVELDTVPLPKTSNPGRLAENLAVFDFELSDEDREAISDLERDHRLGFHPDAFVD
jgi:2,5-diketo-D-gluconate reductase A